MPASRDRPGGQLDPKVKSHRMLRAAMVLSATTAPMEGFRGVAEREVVAIPRPLTDIRSL